MQVEAAQIAATVGVGLAAIAAGVITNAVVGSKAYGKFIGVVEEKFKAVDTRFNDHKATVATEQAQQWQAISGLREDVSENAQGIARLEGAARAAGAGD